MATQIEVTTMEARGFVHEPNAIKMVNDAGAGISEKGGAGTVKWFAVRNITPVMIPMNGDAGHVSRFYDRERLESFIKQLKAGELFQRAAFPADDVEWCSIKTAVAIIGCSDTKIHDLRKEGKIRARDTWMRVGKNSRVQVNRADVISVSQQYNRNRPVTNGSTWAEAASIIDLRRKVDFIASELGIKFPDFSA